MSAERESLGEYFYRHLMADPGDFTCDKCGETKPADTGSYLIVPETNYDIWCSHCWHTHGLKHMGFKE